MQEKLKKIIQKFRKMPKKKQAILIGSTCLVVIVIVGGLFFALRPKKQEMKKEDKKIEEKKEPEVEQKKVQIIDLDSNSRNIAVMINNIRTVWGYQSGLQDAYMVYEIIVEGGYTRLMAVFKDKNTERVGSVRSSRPYYLDYALENDAVYVHFGGSDQALAEIPALGIQNINFLTSAGYWRDTSLKLATEHTAYTSMKNIQQQIGKRGYRNTTDVSPVLNYSADEIELTTFDNSTVANKVYIEYSGSRNTSFEYDPETKVYKRFQNGVAHIDYVTKEQYTAKNIITYQVENYSLDSYGRQALRNIGSGTGYYISNGQAIEITWSKESRNAKTVYKYKDGTEIKVNDGNTYIEIQPKDRKITIE